MSNSRAKRLFQSTGKSKDKDKRNDPVSLETRADLVALGIPEKDHTFDRLLRFLPGDVAGGQLNTEALAKILVHRVKERMARKIRWLVETGKPNRRRTGASQIFSGPMTEHRG